MDADQARAETVRTEVDRLRAELATCKFWSEATATELRKVQADRTDLREEVARLTELVANAVPLIESLTDVGGVSAASMAWLQHAPTTE